VQGHNCLARELRVGVCGAGLRARLGAGPEESRPRPLQTQRRHDNGRRGPPGIRFPKSRWEGAGRGGRTNQSRQGLAGVVRARSLIRRSECVCWGGGGTGQAGSGAGGGAASHLLARAGGGSRGGGLAPGLLSRVRFGNCARRAAAALEEPLSRPGESRAPAGDLGASCQTRGRLLLRARPELPGGRPSTTCHSAPTRAMLCVLQPYPIGSS
jgi:hypothetical protein